MYLILISKLKWYRKYQNDIQIRKKYGKDLNKYVFVTC